MSKPNNSISKIKLPGESTGRPIVPNMFSDGTTSNIATLKTLSEDKNLTVEGIEKTLTNTTLARYSYFYFGEIIPDDVNKPWHCICELSLVVSGQTFRQGYIALISSLPSWNNAACDITAVKIGTTINSGNSWYLMTMISVMLISQTGLDNDYGHAIGFYTGGASPSNWNASDIKVKIIREDNCHVNVFDNLILSTNLPQYQYASNWSSVNFDYEGLNSPSISSASQTVYVTYPSNNNNNYYFVSSANTNGKTTLAYIPNIYYRNGQFNSTSGYTTYNTTYYDSYINYYDEDDDEYYSLNFPSKQGTVALLSDVNAAKVPIEDLTNL